MRLNLSLDAGGDLYSVDGPAEKRLPGRRLRIAPCRLTASIGSGVALWLAPATLPLPLPLPLVLALALPLTVWASRPTQGRALRRAGLCC